MKLWKSRGRSPLRDRPLRNPGQSVQEARQKLVDDVMESAALPALVLVVLAGLEWWRSLAAWPPQPGLFTLAASVGLAFAVWRIWRVRPRLRELEQAIEGEKAVGQFLERLRERGYKVFHDVMSDGFNVDHVIVGAAGVFTVETKTWSKPEDRAPQIDFDGERLLAAGYEPDRDPVIQAKAQASWLHRIIAETTGRSVSVRPVVVFPGWFIQRTAGSTRDIWVLEPKALPGFLDHEPARLSPEDVQLISYHLSRHIRVTESQEA